MDRNGAEMIREVNVKKIENKIAELFVSANQILPCGTCSVIGDAKKRESNQLARSILGIIEENIEAARELDVPVCQDTGMAVVFIELGQDVHLTGGDLEDAVNRGVATAYLDGKLRCSVVTDPLYNRKNTDDNTPAVLYTRIVPGDKIKITALPKGFGSENKSAIKMFNPSANPDDIVDFVTETVERAGSMPCPPLVVGVGIGGSFDYAAFLSKKALARDISEKNPDSRYAELEEKMLEKINSLGIGVQGFGGKTTALAVNIEQYPTHIAGLPVAVNISCHVTRHASVEL
jgi:fumarate hydratase subunit alpha